MTKCLACSYSLVAGDNHLLCTVCRPCSLNSPCEICDIWSEADFRHYGRGRTEKMAKKRPIKDKGKNKPTKRYSKGSFDLAGALFQEKSAKSRTKKPSEATTKRPAPAQVEVGFSLGDFVDRSVAEATSSAHNASVSNDHTLESYRSPTNRVRSDKASTAGT